MLGAVVAILWRVDKPVDGRVERQTKSENLTTLRSPRIQDKITYIEIS